MKKAYILLAFIFPALSSFAQTHKNELSLSFGPSFPLGSYAKADLYADNTGMAKTGLSATISYSRGISEEFGFEIRAYGQYNPWNSVEMAKQFKETGFSFGLGEQPRYYNNWQVEKSSWKMLSLMAGLHANLDLGAPDGKLYLQPKVFAGAMYTTQPPIFAESKTDTSYTIFTSTKGKGTITPSFSVGASLNYKVAPRVTAFLATDLFISNMVRFSDVDYGVIATNGGLIIPGLHTIQNSNDVPITLEYQSDAKLSFNGLNTRLGVGFSF